MNLLLTFNKNLVLTGPVDNYCLICDSLLRGEDDTLAHIDKAIHQKNLSTAPVLEKFKTEKIVKVKQGYYCMFCNMLMKTVTKVGLHITDNDHKLQNKFPWLLCRVNGTTILAFEEAAIQEDAWHGLVDNTCIICNTDIDSIEEHKKDKSHVLELIKAKCDIGKNYIYRMVDEDAFFCVICDAVYSVDEKPNHHDSVEHENNYAKGKEFGKNTLVNTGIRQDYNDAPTPKVEALCAPEILEDNVVIDADKSGEESENIEIINIAVSLSAEKQDIIEPVVEIKIESINNAICDSLDRNKYQELVADSFQSKKNSSTEKNIRSNINLSEMNDELSNNDFISKDKNGKPPTDIQSLIAHKDHQENLNKHNSDMHAKVRYGNNTEDVKDVIQCIKHSEENTVATAKINAKADIQSIVMTSAPDEKSKTLEERPKKAQQKQKVHKTTVVYRPVELNSIERDEKIRIPVKQTKISMKKAEEYKKNDVILDFNDETAHCNRCNEDLDFHSLDKHIQEIHNVPNSFAEQDLASQIKLYCQEHYMQVAENKAICKLCNVNIHLNLEEMSNHVNFFTHKDKVFAKTGMGSLTKMSAKGLMQTVMRVKSSLRPELIINNAFVLSLNSFHTVVDGGRTMLCAICQQHLLQRNGASFAQHIATPEHKGLLDDCNIVTTMHYEFIRELRPGVYHCGYCNTTYSTWERTITHLRTLTHHTARRQALWTLERSRNVIKNAKPFQIQDIRQVTLA